MAEKIENFIMLLHELQKIDSKFPLQYAICLAEISLNEGLSLTQLSERTGMSVPTISRIVGALSCHRKAGQPYGLIYASISKTERRRKELHLTVQGRNLMYGIAKILRSSMPERL